MKVITAPQDYIPQPNDVLCFLAGGITNCKEWQREVILTLKRIEGLEHLVVFNPRRDNFPIDDPNAAEEQIAWEFNWLNRADIFSMYFCRSESDQPICMYELGRNLHKMKTDYPASYEDRIAVSVEDGYKRESDVKIQTMLAVSLKANVGTNPVCHAYTIAECYRNLADRTTESTGYNLSPVEDEPTTQTETQNSNLTFKKRTMRDCYNCNRYEAEDECVECHYEPKDECAKEYEELGLKELKELIKADRKTENCSEIPNNCERITEDGVTCAKYPACDDCPDNPLNKVKGSERLVKGSDESQPEPSGYKTKPVEDEPQKDCKKCKNYDRCKNNRWKCCVYQPKDEPQTDCAWR